ncbi:amino acid adenylation domain-containing protein [Amycolatopsis sp. DG1A-15b]|uniref:non-ribosomal peptide synthetase n=1 Tax=Amycolatopsis sp. DG1A-15b TaxID=3052846 RepID=UPI00255B8ED5|nr:amino acid adenylation domain-containing protein [Amycolatopsis sp. DG1A-15b]WIX92566.1 amino acid adenylation domain-containing protein [Amycolatopsis sp. DG1A-15b]
MNSDMKPDLAALRREELVRRIAAIRGVGRHSITKVPRDRSLPASFAQERLWFVDTLGSTRRGEYGINRIWRVTGVLDVDAFGQAVHDVVARHEPLRTAFAEEDGRLVQHVLSGVDALVDVIDLTRFDGETWVAEANRQAEAIANRPFDLASGRLLRVAIWAHGDADHLVMVNVHHVAFDGPSVEILLRELAACYEARSAGRTPALPELAVQYADFAAWQRNWLSGATVDGLVAYWRDRLAGLTELALPLDFARPPVWSGRGRAEEFTFGPTVTEQVAALGRRHGTTQFMTLLAAFYATLAPYCGQRDVAVGTTVAGRGRPETDGMIGFFGNTVVLRADLSGDPTFLEVLERTRALTLDAFDHQDLPFDKVIDAVRPSRDLSRNPLVQTVFVFDDDTGSGDLRLGEAVGVPADRQSRVAKFDLSCTVTSDGDTLRCCLDYGVDLFDPGTIRSLGALFARVVEQVVARPDMRLSELDLVGPHDHRTPATEVVRWPNTSVPVMIFEQAARTPAQIAVVCDGDHLTYRELVERSRSLAARLRTAGVGPESRVGTCLGRGVDAVVGMLGVWFAGGVHVPLDPEYPVDRLRFMVEDSAAVVVITEADGVGARLGVSTVSPHGDRVPAFEFTPPAGNSLAYVIYTSGSTGRPKGVAVEHRALACHVVSARETFELTATDRVLSFSSFSFDACLEQILPVLTVGGRVVLRPGKLWAPDEMVATIQANGVSVLELVPAYWEQWTADPMAALSARELESVRLLVVGGDVVSRTALAAWHRFMPHVPVVNSYGPTEGTIAASAFVAHRPVDRARVPIGRPLLGRDLHVLDESGNRLPTGAVGELYIGGAVARGYLDRPGLTAERFVPDPFAGGGRRLYRSGDLVRWSPTGELEFFGRVDHQVKIRGFRVELGEIEDALGRHPGVATGVAVAAEQGVVAYAVPLGGQQPSVTELRQFLKTRLPGYMVPAVIMVVPELPRLSSGKVDRAALPEPESAATGESVPPRTEAEQAMSEIWAALLRLEHVGVHDNFFDLGGHSLTATVLAGRISALADRKVHVSVVFDHPTVASLTQWIEDELMHELTDVTSVG